MGNPIDLTGAKFGAWSVIGLAENPAGQKHQRFWLCKCQCGFEAVRKGAQLRWAEKNGFFQSCQRCAGGRANRTHGHGGTPEYAAWYGMRDRCCNPAHPAFKNYGGRGIAVCERWSQFENFFADMGPRPGKGYSLDRIDNSLGYGPDNCRWADWITQGRNRRNNQLLTHKGETLFIPDWAQRTQLGVETIRQRLARGWTVAEALETPVGTRHRWSRQVAA